MEYIEVLKKAREILYPYCNVCPECNGKACIGRLPGVGSKAKEAGFINSFEYLKEINLVLDTIYDYDAQSTEFELFGKTFNAPIFIAPIGGLDINYKGKLSEWEYAQYILKGAYNSGCLAFTGDGADESYLKAPLEHYNSVDGLGIPTIKPWLNEEAKRRIDLAKSYNPIAIAMDIDSAGLAHFAKLGNPVYPKSVEALKELINYTERPFILKGIMSAKGALKAKEAGASAIVVSNHGGRVLSSSEPTCKVLPGIREAVGKDMKIFVDGSIRTGSDVFKALALGADAVLIGRPFAISAFGGGTEGVELLFNKLISELKDAMLMTGCSKLSDIDLDKIDIG